MSTTATESQTSRSSLLLMLVLFVGYMMIVYVRESVTYSAPMIAHAENLENSDLGLIVSSQKVGYALIKVVGGTMMDAYDPGLLFTASLFLTGVVGIGFTACSSVAMFSMTWFISGLVQGPSWPACALLMRKSFVGNQFATWWSVLSASSNVASSVGPLLSQALNDSYSWRASFLLSGVLTIVFAVYSGFFLMNFKRKKAAENGDIAKSKTEEPKPLSVRLLINPVMLTVCFDYFLFSIVRGACNDWSQHYVIQDKKQSIVTGSRFISSQEIGGIVGSLVAGYMSDVAVSEDQHQAMPRLKNQGVFSVLLTIGLLCLVFLVYPESSQIWIHTVSFVIGFALYGCITLVGIICMEVAPSHLTGTAHSWATLAANVGRVVAGYPLTLIATYFSWHQSFLTTLLVSAMSILVSYILIPMVDRKHQIDTKKKLT